MYADDTNITIGHHSFGNLQPLLNNELLNINNWLVVGKIPDYFLGSVKIVMDWIYS